jgi:hypothetical protein
MTVVYTHMTVVYTHMTVVYTHMALHDSSLHMTSRPGQGVKSAPRTGSVFLCWFV